GSGAASSEPRRARSSPSPSRKASFRLRPRTTATRRGAEPSMGTIVIAGLRELGVHGVLPEEQTRPQPFEVDVELHVDLEKAGESDALDDTVDYSAVAEAVSRVVASERYQLLERLA